MRVRPPPALDGGARRARQRGTCASRGCGTYPTLVTLTTLVAVAALVTLATLVIVAALVTLAALVALAGLAGLVKTAAGGGQDVALVVACAAATLCTTKLASLGLASYSSWPRQPSFRAAGREDGKTTLLQLRVLLATAQRRYQRGILARLLALALQLSSTPSATSVDGAQAPARCPRLYCEMLFKLTVHSYKCLDARDLLWSEEHDPTRGTTLIFPYSWCTTSPAVQREHATKMSQLKRPLPTRQTHL